jgi:hypothetical protein
MSLAIFHITVPAAIQRGTDAGALTSCSSFRTLSADTIRMDTGLCECASAITRAGRYGTVAMDGAIGYRKRVTNTHPHCYRIDTSVNLIFLF